MKTFSDDALAALQRGDAIVSASVEIIPTSTSVPNLIAEGTAVELDWYQNTFVQVGGNDEARMGIAFLNAAKVQIGDITWASYTQPTSWTARSVSADAPANCYYIRVYQDHLRLAGTHCDGYIDDILLNVGSSPVSLTNADAEAGDTSGWTNTLGGIDAQSVGTGAPGTPSPHGGTYMFAGGNNLQSTAYQDYGTFTTTAGDPIRLWGGYGDASLPSDEGTSTFNGIGDRGLIQSSSGAIGGSAQNTTLALSGIEPAAIAALEPDEVRDASVVVRRLIFAPDGKTLLGGYVYSRGRLDELKTSEEVGGAASIQLSVEGAARGLGRRGGRLRSDADQRLVSSSDGFFRNVSFAAQKTLYWGGKKPSTGASLGGGGGTAQPGTSSQRQVF